MLNVDDLKLAQEGRYTDFSNAIKQELNNKLSNNPIVQTHVSEFERIQQLKDIFNKINATKISEEM